MEVLERACQQGWILSTQAVQGSIGAKPQCTAGESAFERGGGGFSKRARLVRKPVGEWASDRRGILLEGG